MIELNIRISSFQITFKVPWILLVLLRHLS
jgi:hypothetical protein